jgi:hypothetical protein
MPKREHSPSPPKSCKQVTRRTETLKPVGPLQRGTPARRVCVRVPLEGDPLRSTYSSLEGSSRRVEWVRLVLGEDGMYVGRPKNDGGWYQVPMVKAGSFLANPFAVKMFGLDESIRLFQIFLERRMMDDCTLEELIALLPEKERKLATRCFVEHSGGKSMLHLNLDLHGPRFVQSLRDLKGKTLGCFCELPSACHVDYLVKTIDSLVGDV